MAQFPRARLSSPARASKAAPACPTVAVLCVAALAAPVAHAQVSTAAPQHAHVHGIARMGVVVQGGTVSITLESPLDSLIGFEHRPATPAQQAAADALRSRVQAGTGLFSFDAGADCALVKAEAESAIFVPAAQAGAGEEHADLDASFEFRCARPERLGRLDVGLFTAYPRLQRIAVEVVTDQGQFKRELNRSVRTVALRR